MSHSLMDKATGNMDSNTEVDMDTTDVNMTKPQNGIDIDDVFMSEPTERPTEIADLLKWSYALRLRSDISIIAQQYCHGCRYDHPSQMEHDVCILTSYHEQVNQFFEEALNAVDEDRVIGHWFGNLAVLKPTVRYHEVSRYLDPDYRLEEWIDAEWKADVKEKLLALEHHPITPIN